MPIEELEYCDDTHYEYPNIEDLTNKVNEIIRTLNLLLKSKGKQI